MTSSLLKKIPPLALLSCAASLIPAAPAAAQALASTQAHTAATVADDGGSDCVVDTSLRKRAQDATTCQDRVILPIISNSASTELSGPAFLQTQQSHLRMKATQAHLRDASASASAVAALDQRHGWSLYVTDDGDDLRHSAAFANYAGDSADMSFDSRVNTVTVGADHRLGDAWVVGGAVGASSGHVGFHGLPGDQRSHGVDGTVYASWGFLPSAYVSAAASFEHTDFDVARMAESADMAYSSPHGNGVAFSLAAGYDFVHGAFSLSPYARLDSVSSHVGAYSESGSEDSDSVDRQTMRSSTTNLGLQAQYAVPVSWGVVLPQARVELTHESSPAQAVSGAHLLAGNVTLVPPVALQPDHHYGAWALGVSTLGRHGLSGFADFEANFAQEGYRTRQFTVGFRAEL